MKLQIIKVRKTRCTKDYYPLGWYLAGCPLAQPGVTIVRLVWTPDIVITITVPMLKVLEKPY